MASSSGRAGLVVTNLIKLGGLALVFHDALTKPPGVDFGIIALAAFMMAGATGFETFIQGFFNRSPRESGQTPG
jgi:hypothetical protein